MAWSPAALPLAALLATVGGIWAVRAAQVTGDPGWVVIDEFAGQFLSMLGLAQVTPAGVVLAFLLFRVLDIVKPGPIGWADRPGPVGVMADDVMAGVIAALLLWAARLAWPGLFG